MLYLRCQYRFGATSLISTRVRQAHILASLWSLASLRLLQAAIDTSDKSPIRPLLNRPTIHPVDTVSTKAQETKMLDRIQHEEPW